MQVLMNMSGMALSGAHGVRTKLHSCSTIPFTSLSPFLGSPLASSLHITVDRFTPLPNTFLLGLRTHDELLFEQCSWLILILWTYMFGAATVSLVGTGAKPTIR